MQQTNFTMYTFKKKRQINWLEIAGGILFLITLVEVVLLVSLFQ